MMMNKMPPALPPTGGVNVGMKRPLPPPMGQNRPPVSAVKSMATMNAQQVMPYGKAYAKGGMVGCSWSPKSSTTMRGAARKG